MNEPLPYLIEVLYILLDSPYPIEIIGEDGEVVMYFESADKITLSELRNPYMKVAGLEFVDGHLHIVIDEEE